MNNPFEAAINVLNDMAELTSDTDVEVSCWDSIQVLEAAGRVDKERWYLMTAGWILPKDIQDFFHALPDPEEKEKA